MVSQSESFSGSEGDDGTATELEEKIKSDTTTTESFSGSKGDDGTATELEEKIKSDTATVGTPVRLGYYWIIIELRFMIIIFHKDSAQ
ncbi:uncharacterized protein LOC111999267 isoform X2 [Quercus suber]|uniref:uncharacterized protein LOC111999267 isoform X2 n=1 Tax=Quercus suber TaxID=58331 RepID=UPI0032DF6597